MPVASVIGVDKIAVSVYPRSSNAGMVAGKPLVIACAFWLLHLWFD